MKTRSQKTWVVLSGVLVVWMLHSGSAVAGGGVLAAADANRSGEEQRPKPSNLRSLYAVNEAPDKRGSISAYDIDAGHRLVRTIQTVPGVADVRGVAVSALTGKLYVAYLDDEGTGMVYCLNVYDDRIVWNKAVSPGVDRLSISPLRGGCSTSRHGKA